MTAAEGSGLETAEETNAVNNDALRVYSKSALLAETTMWRRQDGVASLQVVPCTYLEVWERMGSKSAGLVSESAPLLASLLDLAQTPLALLLLLMAKLDELISVGGARGEPERGPEDTISEEVLSEGDDGQSVVVATSEGLPQEA